MKFTIASLFALLLFGLCALVVYQNESKDPVVCNLSGGEFLLAVLRGLVLGSLMSALLILSTSTRAARK